MKKIFAFILSLSICVLAFDAKSENKQMGEIAIFNESVGWTDVGAAKEATEKILKTKLGIRF